MLKNAFKKHPLQNRTNVQIKGGGGQRHFEQCSKKLHFFETMASLRIIATEAIQRISNIHGSVTYKHMEYLPPFRGKYPF